MINSLSRHPTIRPIIFQLLVLFVVALLLPQNLRAQTVTRYTNTTDSPTDAISDTATPCTPTTSRFVRTFSVGASYTISDVNIGVLMAHTYRSDINMYLVSPNGTRVQIVNQVGGNAANFNALLDDQAANALATYSVADTATATTAVPPYNQIFKPSNLLSTFNGQNAAGTWTLEICDAAAADSGTFFQADLYLTQPPTNFADLSLTNTVSSSTPANGSSISYTLTVANASVSPLTASGISVRSLLPAGVNFVSYSGSGTYVQSTGDWTVGTLAPGQSATLTISATVNATAGAVISNPAEITSSSVIDLDSTPNNSATTEDDYASSSFTVSGTRTAGIPPTLACPTGSTVFDWDSRTWTAGSTSNSYTVAGIGSVSFALNNPGTWLSNATYGGQSPARQTAMTGGLAIAQNSLIQLVDLNSQSEQVITTITLPTVLSGAQFTIFDVDFNTNQFADNVTVIGTRGGTTVLPTLTNGIANYVVGNSAFGDAVSADAQSNGNVVVTFSSPIDAIVIRYGDHALAPANPGQQAIALHDITFCNPSAQLSLSKNSEVVSDPVNGTTNPKMIPGAVLQYTLVVSNVGPTAVDSDAVWLIDPLPSQISVGTASNPNFAQGTTTSTLTFNAATDVRYSNQISAPTSFAACSASPHNYTPISAYDPAVRYICFNPKGTMAGSTGTPPSFTITFQAQVN